MDRGAWRATVHRATKESDKTEHTCMHTHLLGRPMSARGKEKGCRLCSQAAVVQVPVPSFFGWVTLGKALTALCLSFQISYTGVDNGFSQQVCLGATEKMDTGF